MMTGRFLLLFRIALAVFFAANLWWMSQLFQRVQMQEERMLRQGVPTAESVVTLRRLSNHLLHSEALTFIVGVSVLVAFKRRR